MPADRIEQIEFPAIFRGDPEIAVLGTGQEWPDLTNPLRAVIDDIQPAIGRNGRSSNDVEQFGLPRRAIVSRVICPATCESGDDSIGPDSSYNVKAVVGK